MQLRLSCIKPDWRLDAKLYSIGVPAILNLALPSVLVSFLNSLLAAYSQGYVVILGIYYKLQTFLYLPAGGIVQGMSGSPILQNGRLVGALTHVIVDSPRRGYAIFAESMLAASDAVAKDTR